MIPKTHDAFQKKARMRGYCGIGIVNGKFSQNLGGLWRSAYCLYASYIFTIGSRYSKEDSDTCSAFRMIPLLQFSYEEEFLNSFPKECVLVGIEIHPRAKSLESYIHPPQACYVLGAEDSGLSETMIKACKQIVVINSKHCLNVATAGSIVLYDRMLKMNKS